MISYGSCASHVLLYCHYIDFLLDISAASGSGSGVDFDLGYRGVAAVVGIAIAMV